MDVQTRGWKLDLDEFAAIGYGCSCCVLREPYRLCVGLWKALRTDGTCIRSWAQRHGMLLIQQLLHRRPMKQHHCPLRLSDGCGRHTAAGPLASATYRTD